MSSNISSMDVFNSPFSGNISAIVSLFAKCPFAAGLGPSEVQLGPRGASEGTSTTGGGDSTKEDSAGCVRHGPLLRIRGHGGTRRPARMARAGGILPVNSWCGLGKSGWREGGAIRALIGPNPTLPFQPMVEPSGPPALFTRSRKYSLPAVKTAGHERRLWANQRRLIGDLYAGRGRCGAKDGMGCL
jgi:hypothetical protein